MTLYGLLVLVFGIIAIVFAIINKEFRNSTFWFLLAFWIVCLSMTLGHASVTL